MSRVLRIALFSITLLFFASCENKPQPRTDQKPEKKASSEQVKTEVREAVDTTGKYISQESREYKEKAQAELNDLTRRLREETATTGTVNDQMERAKNAIREKINAANESLESINKPGSETWDEAKRNLDSRMSEIRTSVTELGKRVGTEKPATQTPSPKAPPAPTP